MKTTFFVVVLLAIIWFFLFKKSPASKKSLGLIDNDRIYDTSAPYFLKTLGHFKKNWQIIRDEADYVHKNGPLLDIGRVYNEWKNTDSSKFIGEYGWIKAWKTPTSTEYNQNWLNYGLFHGGHWFEKNIKYCPKTYQMLYQIKDYINIAGFSLMKPSSRIDRHRDSTGKKTNSLGYHLGLIVPDPQKCVLYVDDYPIQEENGKEIIFDSNFEHYAVNETPNDRIILYIDFKIPPPTTT